MWKGLGRGRSCSLGEKQETEGGKWQGVGNPLIRKLCSIICNVRIAKMVMVGLETEGAEFQTFQRKNLMDL